MSDQISSTTSSARHAEERSLDLVQRAVVSALVGVVFGALAAVLAAYVVTVGPRDLGRDSILGLWVMTGVLGLITIGAILIINRRRPYSPLVLLGLLPMAITAFWIFA